MYSNNKRSIRAWFSALFLFWYIYETINFLISSFYFQEMCKNGVYLENFQGVFPGLLTMGMF